MSHQPSNDPENTPSTVAARAGETGHNVRYVLGFGLAGAALGLIAVYALYF